MKPPGIVAYSERYTITEQGRHDLICAPTCDCRLHFSGLILECQTCGTVYGYMREQSLTSGYAVPKKA